MNLGARIPFPGPLELELELYILKPKFQFLHVPGFGVSGIAAWEVIGLRVWGLARIYVGLVLRVSVSGSHPKSKSEANEGT